MVILGAILVEELQWMEPYPRLHCNFFPWPYEAPLFSFSVFMWYGQLCSEESYHMSQQPIL
eukprot:4564724-Prorocentrum_lima.AAC.1